MRKWLVAVMSVIAVGLSGLMVWMYSARDVEGPEIVLDNSKSNLYTKDMTTEDLLEGVKATDEKDGDVSDSLTVENVYPNENGNRVTVIFVAKDSSNNVTKHTYIMETEEHTDDEMSDESNAEEEIEVSREQNEESGDGEETDKKPGETLEEQEDENLTEEEKAQKREEQKIAGLNPQDPKFYLNTYYLKIAKGTSIERLSYVKDIQDDKDASNVLYRKIQITGDVDVNTPGTYELTYYVIDSDGNTSNGAVLTIVVE